jgi:SAM-dependent methyltransferase
LNPEVDVIFMCNVYHHIENRPAYFARLKEKLKPNGIFCDLDWKKGDLPIGPNDKIKLAEEEVIAEMALAGYRLQSRPNLTGPYHYLLIFSPNP